MLGRAITAVVFTLAISATASAQDLKPGETFRDCPNCPEMVVIPAGSFMMGSPENEKGRRDGEGPQHLVTIPRAFALGKYEVTLADWDFCLADGGCQYHPIDEGWGVTPRGWTKPLWKAARGRRPVVNVTWDEAKKYVRWLSRKTGQEYRFSSEAEWEYAARAGTTTARFWGENPKRACEYGNVYDKTSKAKVSFDRRWRHHKCRDGYPYTASVGEFQPNAFGLHDMLGNVLEWVEDCWNRDYRGAPADGSAWTTGKCSGRVVRGGSWFSDLRRVRSADREAYKAKNRTILFLGFRVAKTLQ